MGTEMQGSSDAAPKETAKEPQGDSGLTPCQGLSQKNDCPTPDNGANKDTVGSILARRITGLQSTLEEHWVAAERADSEYRAEIAKLQAEIAFHRKVLATLNAVHAIKETMPPFPRQVTSQENLTDKPVAWAADIPGKFGAAPTMLFGYTENIVKSIAAAGGDVVKPFPLYRQPQTCPHVVGTTTQYCSLTPFTLTDLEREAITDAADRYASVTPESAETAATLRGLLSRTGTNTTKTDESAAECSDHAGKYPERECLTDAEREAIGGMAAYFDTRGNITLQAWGSLLRVLLARTGTNSRQTSDNAAECRSNGDKTPKRERLTDPRIGRLWSDQ